MTHRAVTEGLEALQRELQSITDALADADSHKLIQASESLKQGSLELMAVARQLAPVALGDRQLRHQLAQITHGLALCRENLARRSATVERRHQTIVPAAGSDTYGKMASPYAKLGRQSAWTGARAA